MADEIENIKAQCVVLQKALSTPTGENKGIGQNAFVDWPATFPFPCFVNVWAGTPSIERGLARRKQEILIDIRGKMLVGALVRNELNDEEAVKAVQYS